MTEKAHGLGKWGEAHALAYLQSRGWSVVARNYRAGPKEIDLIVSRGRTVAFVEVKTRAGRGWSGLESVGPRKIRAVTEAARHWIRANGRPGQRYRFDAISIEKGEGGDRVVHVPNAWRLG